MVEKLNRREDYGQFRKVVLGAHKSLVEDLKSRGDAPPKEIEKTALLTTYRLLFFLSASCKGMTDIPDFRKSPTPFIQNILRWVRDNPPHVRRYFNYSDLFEPARQPYLWHVHPSDKVLRQITEKLMETDPHTWPVNWPGTLYPEFLNAGERKESGNFYAPEAVVEFMVDRTLAPFCFKNPEKHAGILEPEDILSTRVLDPSMGDGRFLITATDFLAWALAKARNEKFSHDHRVEVAGRCIYGVDSDPMAVNMARIALWLHIGGPASETDFLRNNLQPGDALMGATLNELEKSFEEIDRGAAQLGLFKPPAPAAHAPSIAKIVETGRMVDRVRSLADLWTSTFLDNEDARELFSLARANLAQASDDKWAEFEAHPAMRRAEEMASKHGFLHWELRFPSVFIRQRGRSGGFSAIIGNPPHRKGRGRKDEHSGASPVFFRWGESKTDFIALFMHRGLDLLSPGGRLSFITSSHWLHAEGARELRRRVAEKEKIIGIVDLGGAGVFPGLSGRHCIVTLGRGVRHPNPVTISVVKPEREGKKDTIETLMDNFDEAFDTVEINDQRNLVTGDGVFRLGDADAESVCAQMEKNSVPLGELVKTSQGVADTPPALSDRMIKKLKQDHPELAERMNYRPGEPVFVIPRDHRLPDLLDEKEKRLLKPFYRPSSIRPFGLPEEPDAYLLYLTPRTCPDLDEFPNIKKHLERYRHAMEYRREVKEGRIEWWHLHWSRSEEMFEGEHLFVPQVVEPPTAARARGPAYAGTSVNVIAAGRSGVSLKFVEALINSRAVAFWAVTGRTGKGRGAKLDLGLAALRKIPVPVTRTAPADEAIAQEVENLMRLYREAVPGKENQ